jgi:hypothetical protein
MERAFLSTGGAALLVTLRQNVFPAGMSDHFVTLMTGNALGPLVPKQDRPILVGDVDTRWQGIQDRSQHFGIAYFRHESASTATVFIVSRETKLHPLWPVEYGPVTSPK